MHSLSIVATACSGNEYKPKEYNETASILDKNDEIEKDESVDQETGCMEDLTSDIGTAVHTSSVACGGAHTAAVTMDGTLYTWGYNNHGQLGNERLLDSHFPVQIMENVVAVSAGSAHTAAVLHASVVPRRR